MLQGARRLKVSFVEDAYFDPYVLSRKVMPIRPFIGSLPYAFPAAAFENGLVSMPWFDLLDELAEIICDPEWERARDVEFLQNALYLEIGANAVSEEDRDDAV